MDHPLFATVLPLAPQQPAWPDIGQALRVRDELAGAPPLVDARSVRALRTALADVAAGAASVIQAGDCAEDPADCTPAAVARKAGLLDLLAGVLKIRTGRPVIRVGRIAGQYGKPRSSPTEEVGGRELPVYRGHLVNGPAPHERVPDPARMLTCHRAAAAVLRHLGWRGLSRPSGADSPVWTSHEALVLDYEVPQLRPTEQGGRLLTSAHWPWVGERTRAPDGAHVALLAGVENPVACKVGPAMEEAELLDLCARLDPERALGRLTLISRMGAGVVADLLPPLVDAVRRAGHPAIWLCDPMHGNTVLARDGRKTRLVADLVLEVQRFGVAIGAAGGVAGGLHLETTPDEVTECASGADGQPDVGARYTTHCDPRLNPLQALTVVSAWPAEPAARTEPSRPAEEVLAA